MARAAGTRAGAGDCADPATAGSSPAAPFIRPASRRNDSHPARGGRRDAGSIRVWAAGAGLPGWRLVSEPLPPDTAAEFAACLRACGYRTLSG